MSGRRTPAKVKKPHNQRISLVLRLICTLSILFASTHAAADGSESGGGITAANNQFSAQVLRVFERFQLGIESSGKIEELFAQLIPSPETPFEGGFLPLNVVPHVRFISAPLRQIGEMARDEISDIDEVKNLYSEYYFMFRNSAHLFSSTINGTDTAPLIQAIRQESVRAAEFFNVSEDDRASFHISKYTGLLMDRLFEANTYLIEDPVFQSDFEENGQKQEFLNTLRNILIKTGALVASSGARGDSTRSILESCDVADIFRQRSFSRGIQSYLERQRPELFEQIVGPMSFLEAFVECDQIRRRIDLATIRFALEGLSWELGQSEEAIDMAPENIQNSVEQIRSDFHDLFPADDFAEFSVCILNEASRAGISSLESHPITEEQGVSIPVIEMRIVVLNSLRDLSRAIDRVTDVVPCAEAGDLQ